MEISVAGISSKPFKVPQPVSHQDTANIENADSDNLVAADSEKDKSDT